ncbi:MAG: hypothetical protein KDA96_12205, partial [Planctomycetaceae bacterium]|nr:hypothetical protein [Planctomycetaceae bacterium]
TAGNRHSEIRPSKSEISNLKSQIPEPPPLEEWLKGRTILTVAQDGSGQFKTIQAALDALQPGQVVEVLDKGPYVETLTCVNKSDLGLFSRAGTVVRIEEWKEDPHSQGRLGLHFGNCSDLRLSGLTFECGTIPLETYRTLNLYDVPDTCIENCGFVSSPSDSVLRPALSLHPAAVRDSAYTTIRDCRFDEVSLSFRPAAFASNIRIEHCFFRSTTKAHPLTIHTSGDPSAKTVARVHHNVIISSTSTPVSFRCNNPAEDETNELVVDHNTISSRVPEGGWNRSLLVLYGLPAKDLRWTNNLLLGDPQFGINNDLPDSVRELALKHWQVIGNAFAEVHGSDPFLSKPGNHPLDLSSIPQDFSDSACFRIPATGPLATGSNDSSMPYIGALPPGPAPPDGDWLTRVLDRWESAENHR